VQIVGYINTNITCTAKKLSWKLNCPKTTEHRPGFHLLKKRKINHSVQYIVSSVISLTVPDELTGV